MAAITSTGSGNWSSTTPDAPWPSGTVPTDGDTVTIASGHTVTIDTDKTVGADTSTAAINVASGGKLQYLAAAAAAYTFTLKGDLANNGTIEFGTVASPIPANRGLIIEFTSASPVDGEWGFKRNAGSTTVIQGAAKTPFVRLNADASANATSLTADSSPSGWEDNDVIVIASTSRTYTETEIGALNGAPSGTTVTVDGFAGTAGGILNAHLGSATANGSMRAEVINLTRNIKIRGISTGMAYIVDETTAQVNVDNVEHRYLGENATDKRGLVVKTTSGSSDHQGCSFYDCEDGGFYAAGSANSGWVFSNNVMYNCDSALLTHSVRVEATSGTWTMDSNVFLFCGGLNNDRVVRLDDIGGTFTNNVAAGCNSGDNGSAINLNQASATIGTFSGNIAHSNRGAGIRSNAGEFAGTILNCKGWRNSIEGLSIHDRTYEGIIDGFEAWGNGTRNFLMQAGSNRMRFYNCKNNSDATLSTTQGVLSNGSGLFEYYNCDFGNNVALTQPIFLQDTQFQRHYCIDCTFDSDTAGVIQDGSGNNVAGLFIENFDETVGDSRCFFRNGSIFSETTTRHTASGRAWNMDPSTAARKLILPGPTPSDVFKVAVKADEALTISVYVRKNAAYNGNAPRLILLGGVVAGVGSLGTNVTDSLTVAADTWEELTVTATPTEDGVCEYYLDCDGTAGNVFVDDFDILQA